MGRSLFFPAQVNDLDCGARARQGGDNNKATTMKVSLFVETSRDGFLTGENGDLGFFKGVHKRLPEGEHCGFDELIDSIDAVVMGRRTFDVVSKMTGWWYGNKPVFVLSRDPNRVCIPSRLSGKVFHLSGDPAEILSHLESKGVNRVYLDGGADVISQFMDANLVDEATVTVVPITIGKGLKFLSDEHKSMLKEVEVRTIYPDFIQQKFIIQSRHERKP